MQIRTTLKYHYPPTRMTIIYRQIISRFSKEVEELKLSYAVGKNVKMVQPLCQTVCQFLRKLIYWARYGASRL